MLYASFSSVYEDHFQIALSYKVKSSDLFTLSY